MQISRAQFIRGDFNGTQNPLRPPWAISEIQFTEICTGCGDCAAHCPSHIIKPGRANYPVVDFSLGECSFCGKCVDACSVNALQTTDHGNAAWHIKASIDPNTCLAHKGVECRSCYDPCETHAVTMAPRFGGVSIPAIDMDGCNGCGACYSVCPALAISMDTIQ